MEEPTTAQKNARSYRNEVLNNWQKFPWHLMGWTIPKVGPVHSYLCTYLQPYSNGMECMFFIQKPSLRELQRFIAAMGENECDLTKEIVKYCDDITSPYHTKASVATYVLNFIARNDAFLKHFDELLAAKVRLGYFD